MIPHKLTLCLLLFLFDPNTLLAQQRKPPAGGRLAVVVDERLAALRSTPQLNGRLVQRLSRGRLVAVRSFKTSADGITFVLVNVSRRTHGWIQRDAVVSPSRAGDDRKLLTLVQRSSGFDRIARARIFLDHFTRSPLRPEVLLLLGDTAEALAEKLSLDAIRRLKDDPGDAPPPSTATTASASASFSTKLQSVFTTTAPPGTSSFAVIRTLARRPSLLSA
jgi:hypothetical protein